MKISLRTTVLSIGWFLAIAVGFLIGRQTHPAGPDAASSSGAGDRPASPLTGAKGIESRQRPSTSRPNAGTAGSSPRRDRERALAELGESLRLSDRLARTRRILDLADTLSAGQFEEVVEAFRADDISRLRGTEYSLLLNAWVKADPYAAAEYVEANDDSSGSRRTVLAAWAAIDAGSAMAWITERGDEDGTNEWLVGLVSGVASNDPLQALQFVEDIGSGGTRAKSMQAVLPHVLQNGFDYAIEWVARINNPDLQRETTRHLARELARLDVQKAGEWVGQMPSGPARSEAAGIISDQWARDDLESARQWAERLPEDIRAGAAEGIARQMVRKDLEGTAAWLSSLGTDPGLDQARRTFIEESTNRDPQLALENVYTLSQAAEQEKMYQQVLKDWSAKNAKAVTTWVAYNAEALPPGIVKRFTPPPKKEPKAEPKKDSKKQGHKAARKQGKA